MRLTLPGATRAQRLVSSDAWESHVERRWNRFGVFRDLIRGSEAALTASGGGGGAGAGGAGGGGGGQMVIRFSLKSDAKAVPTVQVRR